MSTIIGIIIVPDNSVAFAAFVAIRERTNSALSRRSYALRIAVGVILPYGIIVPSRFNRKRTTSVAAAAVDPAAVPAVDPVAVPVAVPVPVEVPAAAGDGVGAAKDAEPYMDI